MPAREVLLQMQRSNDKLSGPHVGKDTNVCSLATPKLILFDEPSADADLPRDENEFRRLHAGEMRVLPERLAERIGVEKFDVGHRRTPSPVRHGMAAAAIATA